MQNDDYRLVPLAEFRLNVILAQKLTNQPANQTNKQHISNEILPELFGKLFYSSFNTAYVDTDLLDYKMVLNQSSKHSHLGNAFKSVISELTF